MGAPAGWVPAGSLLTSWNQLVEYQPGRSWPPTLWLVIYWLAGWLAGFIHFAIDLLLLWFKNKPKQNEKEKKKDKWTKKLPKTEKTSPELEVLDEKNIALLPIVILEFMISTPNFTKFLNP